MAPRTGIRSLMKTVAACAELDAQRSAELLRWAQTSNATNVITELATRADLDPDTAALVAENRTASVRTARLTSRDLPVPEFVDLLARESRLSVLTKVAERLCDHDDPGRTEKLSAMLDPALLPVLAVIMVNAPQKVANAAANAANAAPGDVAFDTVRELGARIGRNDELRAALTASTTNTKLMRMCLLYALPGELGEHLDRYWHRLAIEATDPTKAHADALRLCAHFEDPIASVEQFRRDASVAAAFDDGDLEELSSYAGALTDAASSDPTRIASAVEAAVTDSDGPRKEHLTYLLAKNPGLTAVHLGRLAGTRRTTNRRVNDLLTAAVTGAVFEPGTAAKVYVQLLGRDDEAMELLRNSIEPVAAFRAALAAIDPKARNWAAELLEELYRIDRAAAVATACQVLTLSDFDGHLPAPGVLGEIADLVTTAIDDDVTAEFAERYSEDFDGSVGMFLDTMAAAFPRSS